MNWNDEYEYQTNADSSNMFPHENWSANLPHTHNIGLLRDIHSTPDLFNGNYIRPIALPTVSDANNSFDGYTLRTMGFGNGVYLSHGNMRVILNSVCQQTFPSILPGNICAAPDYDVAPCLGKMLLLNCIFNISM